MNKMIALTDFELGGDSIKKDAMFEVNEEQTFVLTRHEKARRATAEEIRGTESAEPSAVRPDAGDERTTTELRVPRIESQQ